MNWEQKYKKVVHLQSLVSQNTSYIKQLNSWDKNGSHQKAILTTQNKREELFSTLLELMRGEPYEDWKKRARKLSGLKSNLRAVMERKEKLEKEIKTLQSL